MNDSESVSMLGSRKNPGAIDAEPLPETEEEAADRKDKYIMSIGYMLAMGVCGTVLVALGSTLDDLAENCGTTSTNVGTVFIARGIGAVLGALVSAKLYLWFHGNHVMTIALTLISILIGTLPLNKSVVVLHVYFLLLGIGTAVTDTGCQIMTRKMHGKQAGPWLGANTVAFGIAGAIVPLIEVITGNITVQYTVIAILVTAVTLLIVFAPEPRSMMHGGGGGGGPPRAMDGKSAPHYHVELVISLMVFCFIGGKVTTTAYLTTYVDDTGVISSSDDSMLIMVLWIAITVGRLAGVQDQRFLTNKTLPVHLSIFCIGGFLSMLLIMWFPNSGTGLWIGVAFYGLFNGPCVGYCYDLNNRITYPTEKSMSIVMFGLNFGASIVPYMTTLIWNNGGGPMTLIVITFLTMFLPLPLLHTTKYLSYDPSVNPRMKHAYSSLSTDDQPI